MNFLNNFERCLLLLIRNPDEEIKPSDVVMKRLFKLSPAESEMTSLLTTGLTLKESAERQNVSMETARTRIKNIFAKTNTSKQSELIRLLVQLNQ
jgi:DNA-binding CsgD family transcriptional regulator